MDEDEYLTISGLNHFAYCKRRWALVHIEQQWQYNVFTYRGQIMHKKADNPYSFETRGDVIISRALPIVSHQLRIYGISDVVEYHSCETGVPLPDHEGLWSIVPIEYKSGKKKYWECNDVQLCCQAMCLEEMYHTNISSGFLYYGKSRSRVEVMFDSTLRNRVISLIAEMYQLFDAGVTPPAIYHKYCESCSMINACVPKLSEKKQRVSTYLDSGFLR